MQKRWLILLAAVLLAAGCARAETPSAADSPVSASATPGEAAEEAEPGAYSNITVTVRRNAETVSERAVTSEEEMQAVQEIVLDHVLKSAAWEGVEVSELEDCITLSFDLAQCSERQSYFQYESEGRHVLQAGEAGMYSIMSGEAYEKLMQLAGLAG